MKKIQAEVLTVPGFNKSLIRITAQSHRGNLFGDNSDTFVASNGIILISRAYPARDENRVENPNKVYTRGYDYSKDNNSFDVKGKRVEKIVQAFNEYNAYFSDASIAQREYEKRLAARRAEEARQAAIAAENVRKAIEAARKAEEARQAELARRANSCTYFIG